MKTNILTAIACGTMKSTAVRLQFQVSGALVDLHRGNQLLPQIGTEVVLTQIFDYPVGAIIRYLEWNSTTADTFRTTWVCIYSIWENIA